MREHEVVVGAVPELRLRQRLAAQQQRQQPRVRPPAGNTAGWVRTSDLAAKGVSDAVALRTWPLCGFQSQTVHGHAIPVGVMF